MQLTPPTADGNWQREVLPDGAPLELLLVCDTSASMDAQKRRQQTQFVTSVLATLGPRDRFNLAVCDVNCDWLHDTSVEPTEDAVAGALAWLDQRISLGWTDLNRMAATVLKRLNDQTHVVYVGDGVVTAGDADPQSFANRLGRLAGTPRSGTFHAVSIGSSFESTVLKAIARIGGVSVRHIAGEQTPQQGSFELLNEITQPGLRNLKVEFRGLQVAAVYPDTLPNFAFTRPPLILARQTNSYQSIVRQTADALKRMLGVRAALEFLIERFETYPERFEYTYEAPWQQFSYQLAEWFKECGQIIGDHKLRLLAIVLDELRDELRNRQSGNHYLYYRGNQYFWEEQAGQFGRVAEQVYQEQQESGRGAEIKRTGFIGWDVCSRHPKTWMAMSTISPSRPRPRGKTAP